jgi:hypothetical protein
MSTPLLDPTKLDTLHGDRAATAGSGKSATGWPE